MGILKRNQKNDIRYKGGDFVLYEPTDIQREELRGVIEKLEGQEGNLDTKTIRYIMRDLSSLGNEIDELTDQELDNSFENINRDGQLFLRAIEVLIDEIVDDINYTREKFVKLYKAIKKIEKLNKGEQEVLDDIEKILKKNGINASVEEFVKYKDDPEKLKEIINNSKIKNNKRKK